MNNTILNVGKHIGKTYESIYNIDKGYCDWILSLKTCDGELGKFKSYIKAMKYSN